MVKKEGILNKNYQLTAKGLKIKSLLKLEKSYWSMEKIFKLVSFDVDFTLTKVPIGEFLLEKCIHVEDSKRDIEVFKKVGFGIAINPKYQDVGKATDDSLEVYGKLKRKGNYKKIIWGK